jgi:MipA family protein
MNFARPGRAARVRKRLSTVHRRLIRALTAPLLAALCTQAWAAEESSCTAPSPDCAVVGRFEISASIGFGQRSNPVEGRSDIPLVVIPHVSWYGKRFFLENLEGGFTLYEGEANTFNLIAAPGYDRVFFYRIDFQNLFVAGTGISGAGGTTFTSVGVAVPPEGKQFEVKDRHTTYLAGPEWSFTYGPVTGQLNALREVTGENDGVEVRGARAVPLLARQRDSLVAGAGFTWKSSEIVRYYYGIDGLYQPGSALNPFVKLRYSHTLSDRWTINAFAHYEKLGGAIANSPIITENHVTTAFAGVVFRIH